MTVYEANQIDMQSVLNQGRNHCCFFFFYEGANRQPIIMIQKKADISKTQQTNEGISRFLLRHNKK